MPQSAAPRRRRLDLEAFAREVARGRSQVEALRLAGSRSRSPHALSRTAGRLLRLPEVRSMLDRERATAREIADVAFRDGIAETARIARREAPDVTNRDVLDATTLLGRAVGAFVERVEAASTVSVSIRGFLTAAPPLVVAYPALPAEGSGMP